MDKKRVFDSSLTAVDLGPRALAELLGGLALKLVLHRVNVTTSAVVPTLALAVPGALT